MAPQDHPQQFTCTGLSSFNSNNSFVDMKCYGITSPLRNAYVDLVEHNEAREKPSADSSLHNLSCWGSAVYQHEVDPKTGTIPAPACLGIEFQRYVQAAVLQSAASASGHAMHHQQHMPAVARDIELLHDRHHASTSSTNTPSESSSSTEAYMRHAASTSGQASTSPSTTVEGPEYHGRPSILQRLQDLHAEASERIEEQGGPLWFGRAFANRAALNWDSMCNMAGQVLESAKADLGFPSSKSEEGPK